VTLASRGFTRGSFNDICSIAPDKRRRVYLRFPSPMIYMHIFFPDDQSESNVAMHPYLPTTVLQYHGVKGRFAGPHDG
jgi:hypothetical protein